MPRTLTAPVYIGDTVYSACVSVRGLVEEPFITRWKVEALRYDGEEWYCENADGDAFEYGEPFAFPSFEDAADYVYRMTGVVVTEAYDD